jgi:hypothetical protein
VSVQTLHKRLKEKGLLRSTDERRQTLTVRRTIEGVKRNVLHLGKGFLFSDDPEPDKPDTGKGDPLKHGDSGPASVSGPPVPPDKPDTITDTVSGFAPEGRVADPEPDTGERLSNAGNEGKCRVCRVSEKGEGPHACAGGACADRRGSLDGQGEYELVTTPGELDELLSELRGADAVAVDLETTGLDPCRDRVRLVSLSTAAGSWLVDCSEVDPGPLLPVLAPKRLLMHNAQFDLGFLFAMGLELGAGGEVTDTMLVSKLLENKEGS